MGMEPPMLGTGAERPSGEAEEMGGTQTHTRTPPTSSQGAVPPPYPTPESSLQKRKVP